MNTHEIPLDPQQRWEWVKYQLRSRGSSLATLARQLDVTVSAVKNTKRTAYPRMEREIAAVIGVSPAQIWPERWKSCGKPQRQRPNRAENNAAYAEHNGGCVLSHVKHGAEA